MVTESTLAEAVERTARTAEQSLEADSLVGYEELDVRVRELEGLAREMFQDAHRRLYEQIAEKLDHGARLSVMEHGALELLIVGEAKYYVEAENNFTEWKSELKRLIDELQKTLGRSTTEAERLLHLQALCNDAKGVLPDITFYLRQRERIEQFRQATGGEIAAHDARFLAGIIRQMVSSDRR
ncbi:MAG: hypothetical protein ACREMQ_20825 [Longimicrobiales bacterium]